MSGILYVVVGLLVAVAICLYVSFFMIAAVVFFVVGLPVSILCFRIYDWRRKRQPSRLVM